MSDLRIYIIVRQDLELPIGKAMGQAAHAAEGVLLSASYTHPEQQKLNPVKKTSLYTVLALALSIALVSCKSEPATTKYRLVHADLVNTRDTATRNASARFITETVRAASQHMTGGDYEDPEDVIEQAQATAYALYSQDVIVLEIQEEDQFPRHVAPWDMSPAEKERYDLLLAQE